MTKYQVNRFARSVTAYIGPVPERDPDGCPACGRATAVTPRGKWYSHYGRDGHKCPMSGIAVEPIHLTELPPVRLPPARHEKCGCGWRPRCKSNGEFEAHRISPDDPSAPYCENGATRSY